MSPTQSPPLPLVLDRANERVHRGEIPLRLTPKAFAVLRHLMERQGRLATKDELLAAVWPDTSVTEASLATCIREIRRALEDDPATPAYIQTVHREAIASSAPRSTPRALRVRLTRCSWVANTSSRCSIDPFGRQKMASGV